jgi:DNA-binding response OmpR family regulator
MCGDQRGATAWASNSGMLVTVRVLVVEDDAPIAASLVRGLRAHGYEVELETSGDAAAARGPANFDVAVIDLGLPGLGGLELLRLWRGRTTAPLIVLTARNALDDRLAAFAKGAADFVPKPFFLEELIARIEARLGRTQAEPARVVEFETARVELTNRTVTVAGQPIELTGYEFNVLAFLLERPGRAVPRFELAEKVLREDTIDARTVDSHVARLRKKLGAAGAAIKTVWGVGYSFRP